MSSLEPPDLRTFAVDGFSWAIAALAIVDAVRTNGASCCTVLDLYLRLLAVVAAGTLLSLSVQIEGLAGNRGIEPFELTLSALDEWVDSAGGAGLGAATTAMAIHPEILWTMRGLRGVLSVLFRGRSDADLRRLCLAGAALAVAAAARPSPPLFAAVYIIYLSMKRIGAAFLNLQFDALLLELLFVAVPLSYRGLGDRAVAASVWLLRLICFRLLFGSGVVKVTSGDLTWWDLTATQYHFQTQPLPVPLARHLHFLPPGCHRWLTMSALSLELVIPPAAFFGTAAKRATAAAYVALQLGFALSGSYGHFNWLSGVLALTLLDDGALRFLLAVLYGDGGWGWAPVLVAAGLAAVLGAAALGGLPAVMALLAVFAGGAVTAATRHRIGDSDGLPWPAGLPPWLDKVLATAAKLVVSPQPLPAAPAPTLWSSLVDAAALTFVAVVALGQWTSFRNLMTRAGGSASHPLLKRWHSFLQLFLVGVHYGLFANMTVRRHEVVVERSDDGGTTWEEYPFRYKPGRAAEDPSAPGAESMAPAPPPLHLPRLDWRLWFVPLRPSTLPAWFSMFMARLLEGSPTVLKLLAPGHAANPARPPPQLVRATIYDYKFIKPGDGGSGSSSDGGGAWNRTYVRDLWGPGTLQDALRGADLVRRRAGTEGGTPVDRTGLGRAIREVLRSPVPDGVMYDAAAAARRATFRAALASAMAEAAAGATGVPGPVVVVGPAAAAAEAEAESAAKSAAAAGTTAAAGTAAAAPEVSPEAAAQAAGRVPAADWPSGAGES